MTVLLKDIEELKGLGECYELDSTKRYLLLIPEVMSFSRAEDLAKILKQSGIQMAIVVGTGEGKWKVFEMEHKNGDHK